MTLFKLEEYGNKEFDGLDKLFADAFDLQMYEAFKWGEWVSGQEGRKVLLENNKNNKKTLRDILSRHPNWSFKDQAVIIPITEALVRSDIYNISTYFFDMCTEAMRQHIDKNKKDNMDAANTAYHQLPVLKKVISNKLHIEGKLIRESAEMITKDAGIKASVGQKLSRIINKWAKELHPFVGQYKEYEKLFAKLSDALNPIEVKRKTILSIHPVDFLLASNGNSWNSCHGIKKCDNWGTKSGTLSYMQDDTSMVFFTLNDDDKDIHREPKITRQLYHYKQGRLIQSRLYPDWQNIGMSDTYRGIVQTILAECLGVPNSWTSVVRGQDDVTMATPTHVDAIHYPDYHKNFKATMTTLKGVDCVKEVPIGHIASCIDCGTPHKRPKMLSCCIRYKCRNCNTETLYREMQEHDNYLYCAQCIRECPCCNRQLPTRWDWYTVTTEELTKVKVCESCASRHYTRCEFCNEYHHSSTFHTLRNASGREKYGCPTCYENSVCCADCGQRYHNEGCLHHRDADGNNTRICEKCLKARERKRLLAEQKARDKAEKARLKELGKIKEGKIVIDPAAGVVEIQPIDFEEMGSRPVREMRNPYDQPVSWQYAGNDRVSADDLWQMPQQAVAAAHAMAMYQQDFRVPVEWHQAVARPIADNERVME